LIHRSGGRRGLEARLSKVCGDGSRLLRGIMRRSLATSLVAVFIVGASVPASAERIRDPDDSRSRLDIAAIKVNYERRSYIILLRMHERWRSSLLRDSVATSLRAYWNEDDDGDSEWVWDFRYVDGELRMYRTSLRSGRSDGYSVATRPNRRTVRAVVRTEIPPPPGGGVSSFTARSRDEHSPRCQSACNDRAPDRGRLRGIHELQ
jgi:hypothetical protein